MLGSADDAAFLLECKKQLKDLYKEIELLQPPDCPSYPLRDAARAEGIKSQSCKMKRTRLLKGHMAKVYGLAWARNSRYVASVSQDSNIMVEDSKTSQVVWKAHTFNSSNMTVDCSPSDDTIAVGGLSNVVMMYRVNKETNLQPTTIGELSAHEGYLACCRYVSNTDMLTASGDSTCMLWDIETQQQKSLFKGHLADVMSVSVNKEKGIFVSGSCDQTARVWDFRDEKTCIQTFRGHQSDINSVAFFPDGTAFATGSDDSCCRLYDLRSYGQLNKFSTPEILCGVTSVSFSYYGSLLFAAYDDSTAKVWDTCHANPIQTLPHDNRVSCLSMSPDGKTLATGSWDNHIGIWTRQ